MLYYTSNKFKSYLDKFWQYQDIVYDYKTEIHGTGKLNPNLYFIPSPNPNPNTNPKLNPKP